MALINLTPQAVVADLSAVLGILTSSAAIDIVGVFNADTFQQVFPDARPVKAQIRRTSKTMEHPVENGTIIADHRIINPNEIFMQMIVSTNIFSSVYNEILNLFNAAELLVVQTKTGVYLNMFIADMPHEESSDMFDSITLGLHLKEVLYVQSVSIYAPAPVSATDPKAADYPTTVPNGQVSPAPAVIPNTDPGIYNGYTNPGGWS